MQSELSSHSEQQGASSSAIKPSTIDDDSLIDLEVLKVVSNHGGDAAFLFYLFTLFEKHGLQSLNELQEGIKQLNPQAIHHVAHRWRGSCLNVGAQPLAALLHDLEERPISDDTDRAELEEVWNLCSEIFTRTCRQLHSQLPQPQPS